MDVPSIADSIQSLCRWEKLDTGPKNSQTMELKWGKSQVSCWEETFVVLLVPCFVGPWTSTEMGAEGKEKGKIHLSFSPALSQHTLPLKLRDFGLFLRTSIFVIFIVL